MAIPFYEDEETTAAAAASLSSIADGDQVDGHMPAGQDQVDYEGPPAAAAPSFGATGPPPAASSAASTSAPTTEEQLLAWKMLALTMCKVLKQFYMQQKQQPTNFTAVVQIVPQQAQQ